MNDKELSTSEEMASVKESISHSRSSMGEQRETIDKQERLWHLLRLKEDLEIVSDPNTLGAPFTLERMIHNHPVFRDEVDGVALAILPLVEKAIDKQKKELGEDECL